MAEDRTLAGNVRAAALHMFDDCNDSGSKFFVPIRPRIWPLKKYYDPEILERLVALTDEQLPISKNGDLNSLHRLALKSRQESLLRTVTTMFSDCGCWERRWSMLRRVRTSRNC